MNPWKLLGRVLYTACPITPDVHITFAKGLHENNRNKVVETRIHVIPIGERLHLKNENPCLT
jgi:hypothetical protein